MDRFDSMQVFIAVVEAGSFTAAADKFRISQAMVSKHVNALEQRLGATLLTRTTRSLHLTEIGRNYYENCKQILRQVEAAEAGAEILRGHPKGLLRISASSWFGACILAPIVADYLLQYPEVNIDLALADRFVDIIDEGFDVAIRIGELEDSSYIARKLSMSEWVICASPAYLAQAGIPQTPRDLQQHQCLGFTNWRNHSGWRLMQKQLMGRSPFPSRFDSNNIQALQAAALKGIGIIMMPRALLEEDIAAGKLTEILQAHIPPPRPVHALYPREKQVPLKLSTFLDFLSLALRQTSGETSRS
ncbi:transcriptional regulator, LysR family [Methylobacillus rhizosphaerae]|uniref:Transcriptional regulator, LysR family n=1 Tax=Methylobacillus rhizosphaerae TaxID=551994 RepID=A0A238ZMB6_9PROT|nr:LysR family transcriptional regulator [Methylobacillus rhizosphaerae]SNR84269.1 transcriptional regulator, LysR family [Methylobacillus rhizosphaerae]